LIWWTIAAELPLLARKMARRKQRWLAPREKCAVHELENSITCDISARKFLCNASGDAVTAPRRVRRSSPLTEQRATRGVFFG